MSLAAAVASTPTPRAVRVPHVALSYRAPPECPSEALFRERVSARSPEVAASFAAPAPGGAAALEEHREAARQLDVVLRPAQRGRWTGSLSSGASLELTDGLAREVSAEACDDVLQALVLITVLWMQPAQRGRVESAAPEAAPRAAPSPRPPSTQAPALADGNAPNRSADRPSASAPRDPNARAHPQALAERPSSDLAAREPSGPRVERDAVVTYAAPRASDASGAVGDGAAMPSAADLSARTTTADKTSDRASATGSGTRTSVHLVAQPGYTSGLTGAARVALGAELWGSPSVASWAARSSVAYASGRENGSVGTMSLELLFGQFDICPPGREVVASLWVRGCAHARAGALRVTPPAGALDDARAPLRPWASVGVGLLAGVPIATHFSLRLSGEASAHLIRDRFETASAGAAPFAPVGDGATLFRPGILAVDLGVGGAYDF